MASLLCLALALLAVCGVRAEPDPAAPAPAGLQTYSCIVHVHTNVSSGRYSLPELTEVARGWGVDAIFLTDCLDQQIQYGLPPLRNILWAGKSLPGVMRFGIDDYLSAVDAENLRQQQVLYVPGVEIVPRYRWTGSLGAPGFTCHNHQRNLLLLGTRDTAALRGIPHAVGFLWGRDNLWIILSRLLLALLLCGLAGLVFLPPRLNRRLFLGTGRIRMAMFIFAFLPLLLLAVLFDRLAARHPKFDIYSPDQPEKFEQQVIDYLNRQGVLHYWAHPEAPDYHNLKPAGVKVTIETKPHPDILLRTSGYTGFGSVYESGTTVTDPGAQWDTVLLEYVRGSRPSPAWGFGEMLYHYENQAGKYLGNVETMVWASERTEKKLLDAIRAGRFYARRRNNAGQKLILEDWRVAGVISGATATATGEVRVTLAVASLKPGEKVRLEVVRDGVLLKSAEVVTPATLEFADQPAAPGGMSYYRARAVGRYPLVLTANPIFLRSPADEK